MSIADPSAFADRSVVAPSALTPLAPLSQRERGEKERKRRVLFFSLLSLWERRVGEVRASRVSAAYRI